MVKFKKKEIAALHRYVRDGRVQHMGTMAPVKAYWDFLRTRILDIGLLDVDEWDDLACEEEFSLSNPNQEDWPINTKFVASNVLAMYALESQAALEPDITTSQPVNSESGAG